MPNGHIDVEALTRAFAEATADAVKKLHANGRPAHGTVDGVWQEIPPPGRAPWSTGVPKHRMFPLDFSGLPLTPSLSEWVFLCLDYRVRLARRPKSGVEALVFRTTDPATRRMLEAFGFEPNLGQDRYTFYVATNSRGSVKLARLVRLWKLGEKPWIGPWCAPTSTEDETSR